MNCISRSKLLLERGWKFHLGDVESPLANKHIAAYMFNKAGYARGPARGGFDDSDWREVDLPHDWSVEGEFDPQNHMDAGFLPRGIGWYRRHFQISESERGRRLSIQFDGIATHCSVYVNGHLLHRNFCGYTPFTIDITDVATFGDELNVVAVRVDANYLEGWWYEGAGIYRHVYLISTEAVHLVADGLCVNPQRSESGKWNTYITANVRNTTRETVECELIAKVVDADGHLFCSQATIAKIDGDCGIDLALAIPDKSPRLWSCESPSLYSCICELRIDGRLIDELRTTFGYRTIRFDANEGFFLNDQPVKLKGTCNHQDHAGVGVALPDSIYEFRIRKLLEMGSNAYRCAHNPPAPELLDACDRLGMLVMDENRNFGSSPEHLSQLRSMVLRDFNHPCVIAWSICNEEAIQGTPTANTIGRAMVREVARIDQSRAITGAVSGGILNDDCLADALPVVGINYQLTVNDAYHAKHPTKPIIAAETHSVTSVRGVYHSNREKCMLSCTDDEIATWGATARETWRFVSQRQYLAGMFAWTGFDYRGEPTPFEWPCVNSFFGMLDMCGFEKDSFSLHKAYFTSAPFVQISPHWNWKAGETITMRAYSNCDEVELFLNDQSLGRTKVDPIEMTSWQVEWQPGKLRAESYREGKPVAQVAVETTGPAVAVGLEIHPSANTSTLQADGEHAIPVTVFAVDASGRRVPTANHLIHFDVTGNGRLIGLGNGDPTCHQSDKGSSRSLFNGLAQLIIQSTLGPGACEIRATCAELRAAALTITAIQTISRPAVPIVKPRYFIKDWRMSPITLTRPDANQEIPEQDMNSWERVSPNASGQSTWIGKTGFAIYRAKLNPSKRMQSRGGRIVFHQIAGNAEVWIDGSLIACKGDSAFDKLIVDLQAHAGSRTISVVIKNESTRSCGLLDRVELISN